MKKAEEVEVTPVLPTRRWPNAIYLFIVKLSQSVVVKQI